MKKLCLLLVAAVSAVAVYASPAYRKPRVVKQSDGTELTVVLNGNEAFHYYSTLDGTPLVRETDGDFYYADYSQSKGFVSTNYIAHDEGARTVAERALLREINSVAVVEAAERRSMARAASYRAAMEKKSATRSAVGENNVAVVLVQFPDCKFSHTKQQIDEMFNKEGYVYENDLADCIGSVRDYFVDQSGGKFIPNFHVSEIVTLSNNMAYYGKNDEWDYDLRAQDAVKEGISLADASVDFSLCDNNGDGEVEFIVCLYAGYAESYGAAEESIWPHMWDLESSGIGSIRVDGVKCNIYSCSSELNLSEDYEADYGKLLTGIGTICHEFSHVLGLPDVYDTTGAGVFGMDAWDLMDYGSYLGEGYVPSGYNAYQMDFLGWRELVEIDAKGSYEIEPLTQGGVAYKVVNDANPDEYYILENRKKEGWDTYLPNEGMLVVHIDYDEEAWYNNEVNTPSCKRYTIIPADNDLPVYNNYTNYEEFDESLRGDVWPGPARNTALTNNSTPAAKVNTGGYMGKPITDIEYRNGIVSFNFMAGTFASVPVVLEPEEITATSFVAKWQAVEGASEYKIELYGKTDDAAQPAEPVTLLAEDFAGCVKGNTDVSNTINNCTATSGWEGSKLYSELGGVLRVGTSKNGGELLTPSMEANGEVKLDFSAWLYNPNDKGTVLTVLFIDANGEDILSTDIVPAASKEKHSLTAQIDDVFRVKFSTMGSSASKRAKIDDISVIASGSGDAEKVAEVVTEATSYRFEGLDTEGEYMYRVQAIDEYGASAFSEYMSVKLQATSIEEIVAGDDRVVVYTVSGIKVYEGEPSAMPALERGIYVVKCGREAKKYMVR